MIAWSFAVYSILYEALIWLGFGYVVFFRGESHWWMALAVFSSACQIRPSTWRKLCRQSP